MDKKKTLVIVESPSKARTINAWLGPGFIVEATKGHIKDLPEHELGIDIAAGFTPCYAVIRHQRKTVALLQQLASHCRDVIIATDPDREGEAIALHLAQELMPVNPRLSRVRFRTLSRQSVCDGIANPTAIDENLALAQQTRRAMDRLTGFQVSAALRLKSGRGALQATAGRVQSAVLLMIHNQDQDAASSLRRTWYQIAGVFATDDGRRFNAHLTRYADTPLSAPADARDTVTPQLSKQNAEELCLYAARHAYNVTASRTKKEIIPAPPPFTTATLLQTACDTLKMPSGQVMLVLRSLFEGVTLGKRGRLGLISYPRTDSPRFGGAARQNATEFIYTQYGADYLSPQPDDATPTPKPKRAAGIEDAHECISPVDLGITLRAVQQYLSTEQSALYFMICERFVAANMRPALQKKYTMDINAGKFQWSFTGSALVQRGWTILKDVPEDCELHPPLPVGTPLKLLSAQAVPMQTSGPEFYTEGTLIAAMNALGVGRPGTFATAVQSLFDRDYICRQGPHLRCTDTGKQVAEALASTFPGMFSPGTTATMERELDQVAGGKKTYHQVMKKFYTALSKQIAGSASKADTKRISQKERRHKAQVPQGAANSTQHTQVCPVCGAAMVVRNGAHGRFLGCSRFPKCRATSVEV